MSDTSHRFRSSAVYDGRLHKDIAQVVRLAGEADGDAGVIADGADRQP
jgi:hypothetical protein